jgi:hypothetical protein
MAVKMCVNRRHAKIIARGRSNDESRIPDS